MKSSISSLAAASAVLLLAGCAVAPTGPSVMALPGSGKNFEQFRDDDAECRQYAQHQIGGSDANQAAVDSGVRSAAIGTVVGAVAGAAIGGRDSAGVGAGTGLLVGSMAGTGAAQSSAYASQRNYDNAYVQCMYAKGQQVPVSGAVARSRTQAPAAAPAATSYPPPPSGSVPPPPSGYPPPPPGYAPPPGR
ncbi:MAG: YMGG-like glycine zipper-containing protein [Rhodocyclales bacterium]|nr:YMGG-like glycine zipper-containing protein [Rhodocyclales bacterium]